MPLYIDVDDDDDAIWSSECPARCVKIKLLRNERENDLSVSLHLTSERLPSLWERLCFSAWILTPWWRSVSHRLEISAWGETLIALRRWLVGHCPGPSDEEGDPPYGDVVRVDGVTGGMDLTFEVHSLRRHEFDLVVRMVRFDSGTGGTHWYGSIESNGIGRWQLAWANIFRRNLVEEWGFVQWDRGHVVRLIAWIDSTIKGTPFEIKAI